MISRKSTAVLGISAALLSASLAGCGSSSSPTSAPSSQNIKDITIGTLYAESGPFATSSMPEYNGLKFWASQVDKSGGVFVKALNKKVPVKIVAYNDQSSPTTATTLYSQLISVNHVNVLVADFGSVLTSVAVPIAEENKMLLFDQTGTGASFFTPSNPYIVLTSLPTSGLWPDSLAQYLIKKGYSRIAIVYATNDFDQSQDQTLVSKLKAANITPVYNNGVPTSTSSYSVLLNNMANTHPQAVIELGYPNNDIAFLQALKASGDHFKMVFTIFPGQLPQLFLTSSGPSSINNVYTYPAPPLLSFSHVNYGLNTTQFESAYKQQTGQSANFLSIAGYNTGLIIQKTLETANSLNQLSLRHAVSHFSGSLTTLDGTFKINSEGAQVGETLPVGKITTTSQGQVSVKFVTSPNS
ncbi:amino acid ABC transporter substrate-binding protein [Sulfobacillus thermosulfidooxidans]|uniref:ABC transporter substrate-binding protein n=2 Tax=Sulfobacillus thermosulfidooxidans TaxID=28034 RepID=UPI00096B7293|nr:ABC transporter substrate-binding protein [Sulfobacillus thermosulfidooxidans]OLZ14010.1 amino acid ABC transporter substrate-binding protein [Sulfobacillus thermosulfidooxidans]OLZ19898.1 amino acid ABC transporter substrate-binding protein [Sulfobacillus thermosulfidooxidans]